MKLSPSFVLSSLGLLHSFSIIVDLLFVHSRVAKSQIASLAASVFSNTMVVEKWVVEVYSSPSAPSSSVDQLFRILNFCQVANHKGDTIGRAIEKCLEGWGIDRLFTVTIDNPPFTKIFERLEKHDPSYLPKDDIPTAEDRDKCKSVCKVPKDFFRDDAKTKVARYLDEARIEDEYLNLLNWWKVNSSRFKIISQVARDIYSIPILTAPYESAFSTGGGVLDSLTPRTAEALICAQNWIQSKPLDDMTEEIDEQFINMEKEMEAAF
ncbi:zinc finger BED domain-containing protein RICESLEEPER 4-like [Cucumis melo var. makuwa]|uniref:Zinc finger BED domain-containing protein RICESLEEPER 4-like n=1 Tax=Cucumis melo var. makuwa TaxID=1194695 RepID=A0A5D3DI93_CUCMM|nr:zinc finger BED domain-containing protein RICESLEEPER 4-like [Cucumis melo var. makuwa]TYK23354.1 zinc finger BED domain-containing protein RICESLEEPER 4-like [Cucumis melo var. makuwa]